MKKFAMFLTLAIALFMVSPVMLMASNGDAGGMFSLQEYVASFSAFVATVILLTSFINMHFLKWSGHKKQYLSWFISALIGIAAYFLKLGIFIGPVWHIPIYVFSFALGANGLFDWKLIQAILKALKIEK